MLKSKMLPFDCLKERKLTSAYFQYISKGKKDKNGKEILMRSPNIAAKRREKWYEMYMDKRLPFDCLNLLCTTIGTSFLPSSTEVGRCHGL